MKKWLAVLGLLALLVPFSAGQVPPITKSATVTITVAAAPDFTLSISAPTISTYPNRTVGYTATVTSVNNFAGDVTITTTGLPAGWTITPTPATGKVTLGPDAPKSVSFTIVIPSGAATGTFTGTIKAESTVYN